MKITLHAEVSMGRRKSKDGTTKTEIKITPTIDDRAQDTFTIDTKLGEYQAPKELLMETLESNEHPTLELAREHGCDLSFSCWKKI